ncbi:hypothetical protein MTP99_011297 [Tenebrio molitor]|jgi:hypothetical protein|nr:hypothetical protein MTP99_011297 [Tenebrio molitor]
MRINSIDSRIEHLVRNLAQHFLPFRVQAVPHIKTHVYAYRSTENDWWQLHPRGGSPPGPQKDRQFIYREVLLLIHVLPFVGAEPERGRLLSLRYVLWSNPVLSSTPPPEGQHSPTDNQQIFFPTVLSRRGLGPG